MTCHQRLLPAKNPTCGEAVPEEAVNKYLGYQADIQGWMDVIHPILLFNISQQQKSRCTTGSVGEIGTHHGRYEKGEIALVITIIHGVFSVFAGFFLDWLLRQDLMSLLLRWTFMKTNQKTMT